MNKLALVLLTISLVLSAKVSFTQDTPSTISSLSCWFKADSVSMIDGGVDLWYDLSGNEFDARQVNATMRPAIEYAEDINNHATLFFDGINDFLRIDSTVTIGQAFIVMSYGLELFDNNDAIVSGQTGGSSVGWFRGVASTTNLQSNSIFGNNTYKNGVKGLDFSPLSQFHVYSGFRGTPFLASLFIGRDRTYVATSWLGNVAEIIVFDQSLSESDNDLIFAYLYDKYGNTADLGDDIVIEDSFCELNISPSGYFPEYLWNDGTTGSTLSITESGKYWVDVIDVFGRQSSDTINVTFPGNFISPFTLCTITDSLYTTNLESFDVVWQDGSTDLNYLITEGGTYSLTVTDSEGCSYQSDPVIVTEDFFPTEVDLIEHPVFCLGNELYLSSGFAEAETYTWSTGETSAFITPWQSGTYWVEATNANGCIGRDTVQVEIAGAAPYVQFTNGVACKGNEVVFTDLTDAAGSEIVDQSWVFPGSTAEGSSVGTAFPETGKYPIELTVLLANGCSGTGRDTVEVSPLPLVGFNYESVIPCAGNEVAYESQSGVPGDGVLTDYSWQFGNGTGATGIVGTTVFESLGVNTVQLTVTTGAGCVDSLLQNVVVLGSPVADFSFDTVCVGMATVFNEDVDTSESGSVFYTWKFGDGFFSNFPNTSHTYAAPGVYTVQLTATGNDFGSAGCTHTLSKEVRVFSTPTGSISTTAACLGEEVVFTDMTAPSVQSGVEDYIASREWVLPYGIGQGPIVVGGDSVQVWPAPEAGTYAVRLDFITGSGCMGTAQGAVDVLGVPVASFDLVMPEVAPPFVVVPQNTSLDAEGYVWLMNDEVVSTDAEPELAFADSGEYVVMLVATNSLGCNDTMVQMISVIDPVYDLGLVDIRYSILGSRLSLRAVLSNNGNVAIRQFGMAVQLGLSGNTVQVMDFVLDPGEVKEFLLPQDFEYLAARDLPYVCMDVKAMAGNVEVAEVDYANNRLCVGLKKDGAVFLDPYPNPVSGVVKLGFVLPFGGDVGVEVSGVSGKVLDVFTLSLDGGYSLYEYDMGGYSEGVYFIRYLFFGEGVVKRVVVVSP